MGAPRLGRGKCSNWVRQLYRNLRERLTSTPLRCPVAPESEELGITVRQLINGRYRILFIVEKKTVTILHLKGAYVARVVISNQSVSIRGQGCWVLVDLGGREN